uniref:DUF427 domain-containing protein n=1 Tax=Entomoneis paludosa TaxID=265537 RepID=A0A7S2VEV5_9STRA|mmetsp:Transcript_18998/g.39336  ORF Transcript_18998/g.39336 Transcript_18998/m.39336 type:complete len:117 (+) Transcript_18998:100-450(+)|eukprot:CAMPEP_0172465364 /NCGR_PEP_ID=MMETSP1065-20121228/53287_1 /TAXON_ID=265537 /ORGANISM="Amphiprora paludosa, Strain CCMP125" /LENGTH=116 /DNA_ID=CAMNT_0013221871 /DNA_START=84 /DNA_END=434 /DNA_ORIENTATION=+
MVKAIWNDIVLAESDDTIYIEFNHYFPPESVNMAHLQVSDHVTRCAYKGQANWYHVIGNDKRYKNAAWTYPHPQPGAAPLKDHIAFWGNVKVVKSDHEESKGVIPKLLHKMIPGKS